MTTMTLRFLAGETPVIAIPTPVTPDQWQTLCTRMGQPGTLQSLPPSDFVSLLDQHIDAERTWDSQALRILWHITRSASTKGATILTFCFAPSNRPTHTPILETTP